MKYTNIHGYPEAIVKAMENDDYSKGKADYSVSSLNTPPRILHLMSRHAKELKLDVSDNMFALFGTAIHYILEKAETVPETMIHPRLIADLVRDVKANAMQIEDFFAQLDNAVNYAEANAKAYTPTHRSEERLYAKIAGITMSGKFDRYGILEQEIEDWKITSANKIRRKDFTDYIIRMNMYRWLFWMNDIPVKKLTINAIMRDWRKGEMKRYGGDYPQHQVEVIDIPLWSMLDVHDIITEKVRLLEETKELSDESLPICTPEERWEQPSKYGVMKPGNKRNTKVFETEQEALTWLSQNPGYVINIKLGTSLRCEEYCAASEFCSFYNHKPEVRTEGIDNVNAEPVVILETPAVPIKLKPDHIGVLGAVVKKAEVEDELPNPSKLSLNDLIG